MIEPLSRPARSTSSVVRPHRGGGLGEAAGVQGRPFRGSVAVAGGQVTKAVLRGPRFVRLFPDVYVSAGAEVDHRLLSLAAFELVAGAGGVLAGLSAATVLGADVAA